MRENIRETGSSKGVMDFRKVLIVFLTLTAACLLCMAATGCSKEAAVPDKTVEHVGEDATTTSSSTDTKTVAFVTETGHVTSSAYNGAIWSGVQTFTDATDGWRALDFAPSADSDEARTAAMQSALDGGAKAVVCAGTSWGTLLPDIAKANSDVQFLLVDTQMTDATGAAVTLENVHCITYREQEAGFLLGYALVKEGYRGLGFCGGKEVPAVQEYGYGFIQGVQVACTELNVAPDTYMAYWYSGTFTADANVQSTMDHWYGNGVDVIFSCGGGVFDSVLASGTAANKPLVGVDADQGSASNLVITSAVKNLSGSVQDALSSLADNGGAWDSAHAGTTTDLGIAEGGVGLATDNWRLANFSVADYQALSQRIASGEITVSDDLASVPAATFQLDMKTY